MNLECANGTHFFVMPESDGRWACKCGGETFVVQDGAILLPVQCVTSTVTLSEWADTTTPWLVD